MLPKANTREISQQLKVTSKQVLITANCTADNDDKCKQALTSIIAVQITPSSEKTQVNDSTGSRVELSFKSGMGGGCNERPVGCVFDKDEISSIKCPG